jgi:hypothetical protein
MRFMPGPQHFDIWADVTMSWLHPDPGTDDSVIRFGQACLQRFPQVAIQAVVEIWKDLRVFEEGVHARER